MEKKCWIILGVGVVAGLILIVAVPLGVMFWPLKPTFIDRCKELNGYDCEKLWGAFEQAYVGRDPRKVPTAAYTPFTDAVNFNAEPNKLMFWSRTKDVVHAFTEKKKDCFLTVEDTALGYMLDGLTWCGKEGSTKTFRKIGCPGWEENNAVGSFWKRVSAAFADAACGDVTVMLNGDIDTPFNPTRLDCEEIWRKFEEAVVRQSSCNVTVEHYRHMFYAMPQTWPCDRFLFWSKTRTLMHSYAAVVRHFWTLEDTLAGYMFNDLIWCGQEEDSGFDFSSCPEWSACRNHPVYSLWRQTSKNFAEMECGNITVLLNGSIVNAFSRKRETCSEGSIVDVIQILQSRGFRWTCTDKDQTLRILQCIQNPQQSSCQTCANSLSHRKSPTFK
ncbi:ADP-ribosyl cyclase/cyclic ADP-ribose hydrolase 1-like isoform X1 [Perca fluviatilis]|uniref:ADP-ribosyl cyclase/cyclic ADP-ribose hydrolase 1-like isoform X1 n=1 Tax=Perca fluviatilis TaxID=8168 RepID=UPI0019628D7A|nr:ADP-ribosyl cyclase/cyclic ADP-ribose hydrolase 1-like isoform X1 [Perca fluviatilis]